MHQCVRGLVWHCGRSVAVSAAMMDQARAAELWVRLHRHRQARTDIITQRTCVKTTQVTASTLGWIDRVYMQRFYSTLRFQPLANQM